MGVVYLAYDPQLDRQVALKVIATRLSEDPDLRRRFLEEGRLAARIDHPHIVPVYEAGEDGGVLYLAMQFIDGSDLRGILLREGPMPAERVTGIVDHVASALDAAHARGLVHSDVNTGNV
jgi:serine/threonine protein kinase